MYSRGHDEYRDGAMTGIKMDLFFSNQICNLIEEKEHTWSNTKNMISTV